MVVPEKSALERRLKDLEALLANKIIYYYNSLNIKTQKISKRLIAPRRRIEDLCLHIDDLYLRLNRTLVYRIQHEREKLTLRTERLQASNPRFWIEKAKKQLDQNYNNLLKSFLILIQSNQFRTRELTAKLEALSPIAILSRGYSIIRTIPGARVVRDPQTVSLNQDLEVMVAKGRLICRVKGKYTNGQKDI
jgi:exodeoxyribonuclease VII large subunit